MLVSRFDEIVAYLNAQFTTRLTEKYQFVPGNELIITKSGVYSHNCLIFLNEECIHFVYSESEFIEKNTYAGNLQTKDMFDDSVRYILFWMHKNLFKYMISTAERPQYNTEAVRLRIAVNMIMKLSCFTQKERLAYADWIKDLYWERRKVLSRWYVETMLPF